MKEAKKGKPISDEDYVKYFGMTKEQFAVEMKDKPGVGKNQRAGWAGHQAWNGGGADG